MIRKLLIGIMCLMGAVTASAQAFDGDADQKLGAGYLNVDGEHGVQAMLDYGLNDHLSLGMQYKVLILGDYESDYKFLDGCDLNFTFNYHWSDLLKMPSQTDIYTGVMLGIRNGGIMAGARYHFSERVGIYAEAQQNLFRTFAGNEQNRFFKSKFGFSVGLTFNL